MSADKKELRVALKRALAEQADAAGRVRDASRVLERAQQDMNAITCDVARINLDLARLEPLGKIAAELMSEALAEGRVYAKNNGRDHNVCRSLVGLGYLTHETTDYYKTRYVLTDLGRAKLAEVKS